MSQLTGAPRPHRAILGGRMFGRLPSAAGKMAVPAVSTASESSQTVVT
jgi:hypothetical protein